VAFLSDPNSQSSPLAQRIQFLEAKGLTGPEIEDALRQTGSNPTTQSYQPSYPPAYGPSPYAVTLPTGQWDWRDYFITAVLTGTAAYGALSLFQKYLLPNLRPPAATAYEEDRDALTAQFDAAEALLKEIQAETAAVRSAVEEQKEKVDTMTKDVAAVVKEMRDGETKTRDEMREIRDEVNNVREMLPKMIEKNKDSQTQSLAELQQELKSLKALLLSRGSGISPSSSSPLLSSAGRPSIPAWQLQATTSQSNGVNGNVSVSGSTLLPSPATTAPSTNGKEKENEIPETSSSS
jgi:peroxin-14